MAADETGPTRNQNLSQAAFGHVGFFFSMHSGAGLLKPAPSDDTTSTERFFQN